MSEMPKTKKEGGSALKHHKNNSNASSLVNHTA